MTDHPVFRHSEVSISVVVQEMAHPDASGVVFTVDTGTGAPLISIEANYGLGETVVGGDVSLDGWKVLKHDLFIFDRRRGDKVKMAVISPDGGVACVGVAPPAREEYCIEDQTVKKIAAQALGVERYYRELTGNPTLYMDMEIVVEGDKAIFVQARPETCWSNRVAEEHKLKVFSRSLDPKQENRATVIYQGGFGASAGVCVGKLVVCRTLEEAREKFQHQESCGRNPGNGEDGPRNGCRWLWELPGAFITELGGAFNHAAVVGRELGKP